MATVKNTYLITDCLNDCVFAGGLGEEIEASPITTPLSYINSSPSACDIYFESALSGPEWATLSGVVATHDGVEPIVEAGLVLSPDGYGSFDWDSLTVISGAVHYLDLMEFIENIYEDITTVSGIVGDVQAAVATVSGSLQSQIDAQTDTWVFDFAIRDASKEYFEVNTAVWTVVVSFPFPGTFTVSPIIFQIVGSRSGDLGSADVRLYDLTNNVEIALVTWTSAGKAIYSTANLQNLPAGNAVLEVQLRRLVGSKSRIHSCILR